MDLEHPRLSHYRLERELGRGFSSIVYEAADERRTRSVALKVLTFLSSLSEDRRADLAERFRREAQAVSALSHPNIVAIYEVGQADDGRQFIAMECLPGETLRQRLHRSSPLSVPEAVGIAVRVADALHYAHGRGIVHRDVKPDNIFLVKGAAPEAAPKLMDFGIAHLLSDQGLTQDGTVVGSPAYMSPEQINGLAVDARTDIFSLAVTLTEMVTGAKPFGGDSIPAVMQQILRQAPDLRAVPDRRLGRILAKALSKNPAARYPDAAAFAEALREAAPLAAAAPSVATQIMARTTPRPASLSPHRVRLAAAGLGALALAAVAALPLVARRPQPPAVASVPAPLPRAQSVPAAKRTRLALNPGAERHEIAVAWHRAAPRPARRSREAEEVRIAEVTPDRHAFPHYAHPARTPSVTQTPNSPLAPRPPAAPARPALPSPPAPAPSPAPVVRVAGVRQELTPGGQTPLAEGMPPPHAPDTQGTADTPPRLVRCPMPSASAALDGPDATVRLRLSVDEDGDVTEATILASSGSRELDDAALDAVGDWQYDPAVRNGRRVPGVVVETVKFSRRP